MILTVTTNPAVDQTLFVDTLQLGEVNRFGASQLDPAGKGINVSRMVHRLGWPTVAFGFLAGEIGRIAQKALDAERVQHYFIQVPGQTRLNVTVVDAATDTATSFYGPGPAVPAEYLDDLKSVLRFWMPSTRVMVIAGSLPVGIPDETHAGFIHLARSFGVTTILDTDAEALRQGVAAIPSLIKPNIEEAQRLLGRPLPDTDAIIDGARALLARGIGTVVISMGARGLICAQGERVWHVRPPQIERQSTVGSGDSLVAGLAIALARGDDIAEGLRLGSAAGAATAMTIGTALGTAADVQMLLPKVSIEVVR
ncbi:MAG: 1-phosphofructokinase [Chloroflexota bacterium]